MKNKPFDPFKNLILDEEEQQIERDIEAGLYVPVENLDERITELQQIARNTLEKTKSITVRIPEADLYHLKVRALEEGLPYQTLLSSIVHKFNTGKLVFADKGHVRYGETDSKRKTIKSVVEKTKK